MLFPAFFWYSINIKKDRPAVLDEALSTKKKPSRSWACALKKVCLYRDALLFFGALFSLRLARVFSPAFLQRP